MEKKNDISDGKNGFLMKKIDMPIEKDIFETADNAPDCYELSALFFVYKFLFVGEYDEMCNISENIKK